MGPGNFPKPQEPCGTCHRNFHGDNCYNYYLQRRSIKTRSICETLNKKCPDCRHVYELDSKVRPGRPQADTHKCGWAECTICEKKVELATHQCYIQRVPAHKDLPKRKRVQIQNVNGRSYRRDESDPAYAWVYRDPPLQVYADFEATTDAEGNQTPILICFETDESNDTVVCDDRSSSSSIISKATMVCSFYSTVMPHIEKSGSNHRGNQNLVIQIRKPDIQRLTVLSTVSPIQLSRYLWNHGTVQGVFPA